MTRNAEPDGTRRPHVLSRLAPLCAAMFCSYLAISIPLPVIAVHVHEGLGLGTVMAGLAVGVQPLANLAARPWAGRAADRAGAKRTLMLGLGLACAANLVALASTAGGIAPATALAVLLVGRAVLGVGESLLITGILTWAVGRAGHGHAGQAMSWNGVAQYSALAVGAPIGMALFGAAGFPAVAIAAACAPLAGLAIVGALPAWPVSGGVRLPLHGVVARIWFPGMLLGFAGLGFAALTTFSSLMFAARGWPGGGLALTAFGIAFAGARLVVGHLPDRLGGRRVAAAAMSVEAAGQMILWLAPSPAVALAGAAVTGLGCSLIFPSLGIEALTAVAPQDRGTALGAFAAFQDLALGLAGPLLGGLMLVGDEATAFLVGFVAAVAGATICGAIRRRLAFPHPT